MLTGWLWLRISSERRRHGLTWAALAAAVGGLLAWPTAALAQAVSPAQQGETIGLWELFVKSFDIFTIVLIFGSVAAVTIIVRCLLDVRRANILPLRSVETINNLLYAGRVCELREFVASDMSFPGRVLRAAFGQVRGEEPSDRTAVREAAELAASEETARWFRKIEPLNVIGNLGPLVGLAGTVWGMILAFSSLGATGGQASPAELSIGISKALFHTLLGLILATPCLLVFGFYRGIVDRLCTRAMVTSSEMLERLLDSVAPRDAAGGKDASKPGGRST